VFLPLTFGDHLRDLHPAIRQSRWLSNPFLSLTHPETQKKPGSRSAAGLDLMLLQRPHYQERGVSLRQGYEQCEGTAGLICFRQYSVWFHPQGTRGWNSR
jgi:hypothetical protein